MKKIVCFFITILIIMFVASCSTRKTDSTPTHEDTLWMDKVQDLRKKDDVKGIIKELNAFLATPRQHDTRMDMKAMNTLSWYLFCDKQQEKAMQVLLRGDSIAHATNDIQMQATFRFRNGRYIAVDKPELGRQYMQEGISMMKQCLEQSSTTEDEKFCAVSLLGYYANLLSYMYNLPTSKRWTVLKEFETVLTQCKDKGLLTAEQVDHESFSLNMNKLDCYIADGKRAEAYKMYKLCQQSSLAGSDYGKMMLAEALMSMGNFQEAILTMEKMHQVYLHSGDTLDLNENYCALVQSMAKCYDSLGMKDKTLEYKAESQRLESAITVHHVNQNLEHLGTEFEVQQRQFQLDEERLRSRFSLIIIIVLGLCLVMALSGYIYYRHVSRILNKKNKLLTERLLHQLEESKAEQEKREDEDDKPEDKGNDNDADAGLVNRFIKEITARKLFCDVNFDRDALLDEMKISRRPFPRQFEACTGKSISQYILNLRLEYAANLMRSKPEYTVDSIALDSGFSGRSTFYRNFVNQFGITPTEYKEQIEQYS